MSKIAVVYWSGTGNTEAMANAVLEGIRSAGAVGEIYSAAEFDSSMLSSYDALAFGCPAMGAEQLEDFEFEPLFDSCKASLSGKKVGLFGSYGWGDGQWMRDWEVNCRSAGAVLSGEGVICEGSPQAQSIESCKDLGRSLVN